MLEVSPLAQFFWASSPAVQFVLAAVMLRRRLHREFPMFFSYTLFRASTALLMFVLYRKHLYVGHLYGYTNLVHEIGCIILRFAVIYELFSAVLKPYSDLRDRVGGIFRWALAALLLLAVVFAVYQKIGHYGTFLDVMINVLDNTVDFIQCGLLLALVLSSRYLRLPWHSYAFGITVGLGIFAAIDLAIEAITIGAFRFPLAQRAPLATMLDVISMGGYFVSSLVWLTYALLPEKAPAAVSSIPEHDLDSWNDELRRLLER